MVISHSTERVKLKSLAAAIIILDASRKQTDNLSKQKN
jgi:hypothetical protein